MKRKLRIFSNIAIICLSVCMFAFGVYAANQVSVTTSGTVTFSATGVYANVTRTVTGAAETVADFDKTIDSSSTSPVKITELKESLTFANPNFPIIMTFTITNLAQDRNLDFTFTGFNNGVEEGIDGNIAAYFMSSTDKYSEEKYNVHPMSDGLNNVETITISFYVIDANKSASLEYDYSLNLTNQDTVLKDNLPITVNDTSTSKNSTARVVKKVGNTVVLGATLNSDSQFLDFEATGASTVKHYAPTLVNGEVQKPLLVVDANATGFVSNVRDLDTSSFDYSYIDENKISFDFPTFENETFHLPIAVKKSGENSGNTAIITTVKEGSSLVGSNIDLIIPSSYTTLENGAFDYVDSVLASLTEYGTIKSMVSEIDVDIIGDREKHLLYSADSNNHYFKSTTNNYFYLEWTITGPDKVKPNIVYDGCNIINGNIAEANYINWLYVPGSVTAVDGNYLFTVCYPNFNSLIIPQSVITFASDYIFGEIGDEWNCYKQYTEGTEGSEDYFKGKVLETMTFSNSITSTFAEDVFAPLEGYLKTINFVGTKAEWNALKNIENSGIPSGVKINCLDESFTIA